MRVTRDMAIDAGDASLEGAYIPEPEPETEPERWPRWIEKAAMMTGVSSFGINDRAAIILQCFNERGEE